MEKWMRGLSDTTALIMGLAAAAAALVFVVIFSLTFSGVIPMIILGGVVGGSIGFALPLLVKGFTGKTPQERKELQQNN